MYHKIILLALLLEICVGKPTLLLEQSPSKQAISTQAFYRGDVPLSYKYSAVHDYTTQKPVQIPRPDITDHHQHVKTGHADMQYAPIPTKKGNIALIKYISQGQAGVQYAPISAKIDDKTQKTLLHTQVIIPTDEDIANYDESRETVNNQRTTNKDFLEPKSLPTTPMKHYPLGFPYIPGHNIQIKKQRSYFYAAPRDHKNKEINSLADYVMYQKPQKENSEIARTTNNNYDFTTKSVTPTTTLVALLPKRYQGHQNPLNHGEFTAVQLQPAAYRIPRLQLHLNVARTYNIAHGNDKAPINGGANPQHVGKVPSHTQAFIKGSQFLKPPSINDIALLTPLQRSRIRLNPKIEKILNYK